MLDSRLLARLDNKKDRLDSLRPLPGTAVARLKEQITVEWIYNSNAIEGSTLTLRETQLILETGLTIGGRSLREHFEVINHRDAIEYVESLAEHDTPISAFHVRQIHKLVLSRIDDENAGQYRRTKVRIAGAQHFPPRLGKYPNECKIGRVGFNKKSISANRWNWLRWRTTAWRESIHLSTGMGALRAW